MAVETKKCSFSITIKLILFDFYSSPKRDPRNSPKRKETKKAKTKIVPKNDALKHLRHQIMGGKNVAMLQHMSDDLAKQLKKHKSNEKESQQTEDPTPSVPDKQPIASNIDNISGIYRHATFNLDSMSVQIWLGMSVQF